MNRTLALILLAAMPATLALAATPAIPIAPTSIGPYQGVALVQATVANRDSVLVLWTRHPTGQSEQTEQFLSRLDHQGQVLGGRRVTPRVIDGTGRGPVIASDGTTFLMAGAPYRPAGPGEVMLVPLDEEGREGTRRTVATNGTVRDIALEWTGTHYILFVRDNVTRARLLTRDGEQVGDEVLVSSGSEFVSYFHAASNGAGDILLTGQSGQNIHWRPLRTDGQTITVGPARILSAGRQAPDFAEFAIGVGKPASNGDGFLVTWAERFTPPISVRAALFDRRGERVGPIVTLSESSQSYEPAVAWDGTRYAIAYTERMTTSPFGTRVATAFVSPGVVVANGPPLTQWMRYASVKHAVGVHGGVLFDYDRHIRLEGDQYPWQVIVQVMTTDERLLLPPAEHDGVVLSQQQRDQVVDRAVRCGGAYLIGFRETGSSPRAGVVRLYPSGSIEPPVYLGEVDAGHAGIDIACGPNGSALVVWNEFAGNLRALVVHDAQPLRPDTAVVIDDDVSTTTPAAAMWNGQSWAVAWSHGYEHDVRGTRVAADGSVRHGPVVLDPGEGNRAIAAIRFVMAGEQMLLTFTMEGRLSMRLFSRELIPSGSALTGVSPASFGIASNGTAVLFARRFGTSEVAAMQIDAAATPRARKSFVIAWPDVEDGTMTTVRFDGERFAIAGANRLASLSPSGDAQTSRAVLPAGSDIRDLVLDGQHTLVVFVRDEGPSTRAYASFLPDPRRRAAR